MPRYIDAEILGFIHFKDRPDKTYADGIQRVMAFVDSLPSADVRENVHGEWIDDYDPVNFGEFRYKCSKCGARTVEWADSFCYRCGADMRGEQDG